MNTHVKQQDNLIRLRDVSARTGLARSSIYDLIKVNKFPGSIPLGGKTVAWVEREIDDWIDSRIAAARPVRVAS